MMNCPQIPSCRDPRPNRLRPGWWQGFLLMAAGLCLAVAPGSGCARKNADIPVQAGTVPSGPGEALRQQIETLTGGHTRIVWARDSGGAKDPFANGTQLALMALDTRESLGERTLSGKLGNYSRPLISPDGGTVVFSQRTVGGDPKAPTWQSEIHAFDWAGGTARRLRAGYAVDVWRDSASGLMWVYAFTTMRDGIGSNPEGYRLFRFPLTGPGGEEVVWEEGLMCGDNIQLNRAGTSASGQIPWPNAGTFDLPSKRFIRYRNGCWPSLAPDDSGVMWVFDGTHENLRMFLPGVEGNWRVPMGEVEGLKGKAAYHPRWSNHPHLICFTGPHPVKVASGSGRVSVILARFNGSLTAIEETVNLQNASGKPDCYPDVWMAGGETVSLDLAKIGPVRIREQAAATPASGAAAWEAVPGGLCFVWERANANNTIPAEKRECSATPKGSARFGPRFDMLIGGGVFVVDEISAAVMRKALTSGPWSMEMAVTPLAPGNEGPQVIFRAGPDMEIQQSLHDFIVRIAGKDWHLGAGLSAAQTTHLAIGSSSSPGGPPMVWINGQAQEGRLVETGPRTSLAPADTPEVQFGARQDGSAAWSGRLETIAFHARPLDPVRVAAHAAWWRKQLTGYTPPARTVVRGRLKEASPRATPETIGAYRRSWTSALYEKTTLVSGPDPGPVFGVAHWTLLDRTPLTGPPGEPGEERELILEPMADHPEMDSENGSEEIMPDGVPFFLDAGPPGA